MDMLWLCFHEYRTPCFPPRSSPKKTAQEKSPFPVVFSVVFHILWVEKGSWFCKQNLCMTTEESSLTWECYQSSQRSPTVPQNGEDHWLLWKKGPLFCPCLQDQLESYPLFQAHLCNATKVLSSPDSRLPTPWPGCLGLSWRTVCMCLPHPPWLECAATLTQGTLLHVRCVNSLRSLNAAWKEACDGLHFTDTQTAIQADSVTEDHKSQKTFELRSCVWLSTTILPLEFDHGHTSAEW